MPTSLVLLHGGGTTGRQWDRVVERLSAPALAPNVPGRLDRPADPVTLTYAEAVASLAADVDTAGFDDVVLVAHSSGGLLVPGLADRIGGDRIRGVVWIAASIPPEGGCGLDCMQARHREGIEAMRASGKPMATPAEPPAGDRMRTAYGGEPLSDDELAFVLDADRWVSDTYNFYFEPLSLAALAEIPRLYVRTLQDRAVPLALQDEMLARVPGTPSVALDVGHVPMVTMPAVIAALLDGMAATPGPPAR